MAKRTTYKQRYPDVEHLDRIYNSWRGMRKRCKAQTGSWHSNYTLKGISVYPRWDSSFDSFMEDMGGSYAPGLTLDRINNLKGYGPDNCRWATKVEQANNRCSNVMVEYNGEAMTFAQAWRSHPGKATSMRIAHSRYGRYGWDLDLSITTPITKSMKNRGKLWDFGGEMLSISDAYSKFSHPLLHENTARVRILRLGWLPMTAMTTPPWPRKSG